MSTASLRDTPPSTYTAVVLYFRHGTGILHTIRALNQQTLPPTRIILVDNASADGVIEQLRSCPELQGVDVVVADVNRGYGAGMNLGAQVAGTTDAILFMTHEVLLDRRAAELLMSGLSGSVVATAPRLNLPNGSHWSDGGLITKLGRARHIGNDDRGLTPTWLDGACTLVRRRAFDRIGGFSEDFFLYWEDVNLGLRLGRIGQVICVTAATAEQSTRMTPLYFAARNRILCWAKDADLTRTVFSIFDELTLGVLRATRATRSDPGALRAHLKGCRDGIYAALIEVYRGSRKATS